MDNIILGSKENDASILTSNFQESDKKDKAADGENFSNSEEATELTKERIESTLSNILNAIENKRKDDVTLLSEINRQIIAQAEKSRELLENYLHSMQTLKNKELQEKVDNQKSCLKKISAVYCELEELKKSLSFLCEDIQ